MQQPNTVSSNSEIALVDLLIALARHRKLIYRTPLVTAFLAAGLSFALPNVYKAQTDLLPPQQNQSGAAALLSQLGSAAGIASGVAGIKNPNDLYVGMLKSRTVADRLIQRFDLKRVYDTESQEKARKYLEKDTSVTSGKDGLISIEFESKDKKLVAAVANGYVEELLRLTKVLAVTEASQRRVFFEQQLEQSKNNLAKAEVKLKSALDNRGVISVDAESRAIVETSARLKAQISAKEIQINSMRAFVTSNHPEYRRAEEELASLSKELSNLENGRGKDLAESQGEKAQASGFENIQVLRDVKYYQMLYEILAKQYEVARLDEAKEPSVVQVLDAAVEPEQKIKPKRLFVVLIAVALSLVVSVAWALVRETRHRLMGNPEDVARWAELKALFKRK